MALSGHYECYEDCTDWYQWGCIEYTYDHNPQGQPLQVEICGWQYIHTHCTTECVWVGEDDPCADPENPSPDCYDGSEPCENCEDHNEDGVEEDPAPPLPLANDPCAQRQRINQLKELSVIKQQNEVLQLKTSQAKEWGTEQNLRNWQGSGIDFVEKGIREGLGSTIDPEFSWNATEGYTIGFSHTHPSGTGPSPDDILMLVDVVEHPDLFAAGYGAINFFKDNAHTTVVTANHTYVIYVNNWAGFATFAHSWDENANEMEDNFITMVQDYGNYDRALLELFGQYVTILKTINNPNSAQSNLYERLTLNSNNEVVINPCP